jgi:nitroimidazol reductase NimA-like FMN-containing flavoprotein (pyridoxamine 5'-phosphate oxidase superfamily)
VGATDEHTEQRTWLEHLNDAECWRLLSETPVGRIGVLVDSAPEIYPVNHIVDNQTVLFRTDPGTKLAGLAKSPAVCFQVDGIDPAERTGWSVLVKGRAQQLRAIQDADERHRVEELLRLDYWAIGVKWHWIRIVPTEVTGRRIWRSAPGVDQAHEPPSVVEYPVRPPWMPQP